MSLLNGVEIEDLIDKGIIEGASRRDINSASLDVHISNQMIYEYRVPVNTSSIIHLDKREQFNTCKVEADYEKGHFLLGPGQFVLASTVEIFNLPNWLSAEFKLKSSIARSGLEHMNACWCDAGWNGSALTLELKNMLQYHMISLKPGMAIGQMIFWKHEPVPDIYSYAKKGRYNGDRTVQGVKK